MNITMVINKEDRAMVVQSREAHKTFRIDFLAKCRSFCYRFGNKETLTIMQNSSDTPVDFSMKNREEYIIEKQRFIEEMATVFTTMSDTDISLYLDTQLEIIEK